MVVKTRYGNQNPTQSVNIPYKKTYGKEAISIYEKSKFKLLPWQKNLTNDLLAVNNEGLWTHAMFGYTVPRQNGKNEIITVREMYGLENGERIMHTAHRVPTSHSAWERLVRRLESAGYVEDEDFTTLKAKGNERIEFIETGGRVEFRTRTSTGGLGESYDVLIIDEAQEYTEDQQSALKYVLAASKNPQTILCGTPPTMVSGGTIFLQLRKRALAGNSEDIAWYEWSVEEQTDTHDIDSWYLTNPSLGYFLTERTVRMEITGDDLDFNIQRLGYWVKYNQKSAITEIEWDKLKVKSIPTFVGGLYIGIKYGKDGNNVSMSIALRTLSNRIFVEAIDCRPIRDGNQWILNYLQLLDYEEVIIDGAGYQSLLKDEMKEYELIKPRFITVPEVIIANSKFEKAVFGEEVYHNNQPSLTAVVTNTEKRAIGSQGGFGYKSQYQDKDINLLDSVILAHYICSEEQKVKKKQRVFY